MSASPRSMEAKNRRRTYTRNAKNDGDDSQADATMDELIAGGVKQTEAPEDNDQ